MNKMSNNETMDCNTCSDQGETDFCVNNTYRNRKKRGSWKPILLLFGLIFAIASLNACSAGSKTPDTNKVTTAAVSVDGSNEAAESSASEAAPTASFEETTLAPSEKAVVPVPTTDRAGNPIAVPGEINRIISLAPSYTETLMALGLSDKIIAIDKQAALLEGIQAEWPQFDLMAPDAEQLLQLKPDIIFASGMSMVDSENPFKPLSDAGICVVYIPSSDSIQAIQEDLLFIGAITGTTENAQKLVDDMQISIDRIADIGNTITDKKSVYFEIGAAPYMYSFGSGVFLNEMIEIIGATNVFEDQKSWIAVSEEAALSVNPDVILTNVNYIPEPVNEIKSRAGWDVLDAVKNNQIFYIDNMSSSLPNEGIIKALEEMAKAVYPEQFN